MHTRSRFASLGIALGLLAPALPAQDQPVSAPDATERAALQAASSDGLSDLRAASALLAHPVSHDDRSVLTAEAAAHSDLAELRADITNDDTTLVLLTVLVVVVIILIV